MSPWEAVLTIAGLGVITVLTRSFFLLPERELHLPGWVKRGLKYAPLAALAAVIAPEVLMTQGELITTWRDARIFGLAAATAYYFWRRDILGTILVGMALYLPLRLGLGW
ncbi:AzlD domain-containing protein [Caldimonas sp.]|mgnify:FL=1|jgi:branched-subunit amino acid transport protein|uniref:AzlD domain-containing protein n=1 Tax=Caldimonas sp. TaxID=2838790 RepID=UPI00391C8881